MTTIDYPIKSFKTSQEWEKWLEKNHDKENGVWMRLFKKASGVACIPRAEALDEALCYGWIDGQVKPYDNTSWLQKFTPRRSKSTWSKRNIEHVERLRKLGKMKESGEAEVTRATEDGRWQSAYDAQSQMVVPDDFLKELSKDKNAEEFFNGLNKSNKFAVVFRLQTAKKPETRVRRMNVVLEMMKRQEKFY